MNKHTPARARCLALLLLPVAFLAAVAAAAPLPPARAEIDGLLSRLESSGCAFGRNGMWYTGIEAKAHLLRKLQYLENKNLVQTTEQFIERAASTSSRSGEPYLVRCGSEAPVKSEAWLRVQLGSMRAAKPAKGAP